MVGSLLRGNDFGGNPQEGGNNTSMIEDCTLPEWGRSPEGEEGEQYSHVRDAHPVLTHEHAAPSEQVLN